MRTFLIILSVALTAHGAGAREYHVSPSGRAGNRGTQSSPFKTISQAATVAQPGDTVTVHEGVYREWVNPPRGGESDTKRIVYQAAPGEKVVIKGSEIIKDWKKEQHDTWKVTLPSSFFGDYNPFNDIIQGEWHHHKGYPRHTGTVYVNGIWMDEAKTANQVLGPAGDRPFWIAKVEKDTTTIWAQFKGVDPNAETVEINVRKCVFYPKKQGRGYITVRGFTMRHAATPWSGAMSEQFGLIGTHWSKGWIIENNVISHSMNTGITLGRYNLVKHHGVPLPAVTAPGFVESCEWALKNGWSKDNIGSHIVRNNHISHCEKNGIHGSLGGIFCTIENNVIHDIAVRGWIGGPDVAGLKLLASNDTTIRNNHIYRCHAVGGIWLDWMAQGTRVTGNLLHDNSTDLFMEVDHGPFLIDNNLFLSRKSIRDWSQGCAYAHNLIAGSFQSRGEKRQTPYFEAHTMKEMKVSNIQHRDVRYYNNVISGGNGLAAYNGAKLEASGNVHLRGMGVKIEQTEDGVWVHAPQDPAWAKERRALVTTKLLGKAMIPDAAFEHGNGTPYRLDTDYFGDKRNAANPGPGPFRFEPGKVIPSGPAKEPEIIDNAMGGKTAAYPKAEIKGTNDDPLYRTCRYDMQGYRLAVPNGKYRVTLKFCEPHFSAANKRVCDVKLQGKKVLEKFDIFAEVGQFAACDKTFDTEVTDGALNIDIVHLVSMACISGIEVKGNGVTKAINCGGPQWRDYTADPTGTATYPPAPGVRIRVWPKTGK